MIAMSRGGRWAVVPGVEGLDLVDLLGTATRRRLALAGQLCFVGRELWALDGRFLRRRSPDTLEAPAPDIELDGIARSIVAGYSATAVDAAIDGTPTYRLRVRDGALAIEPFGLGERERVVAVHGHQTLLYGGGVLRAIERGTERWRTRHVTGDVMAASALLGGRALAVVVRTPDRDHCVVMRSTGELIHRIELPTVRGFVVAEEKGHGFVLGVDDKLSRIDLRYGRIIDTVTPPIAVREFAVDQDSRHLVLVGVDHVGEDILHVVVSGLFSSSGARAGALADDPAATPEPTHDNAPRTDAASGDAPVVEPAEDARPIVIPDLVPLAFGPLPAEPPRLEPGESPYQSARDHLDALLDVVASRTALAIADAWNSGRLSSSNVTSRPHEIEVSALLGGIGGFAAEHIAVTQ